jgi:hypothetical protein
MAFSFALSGQSMKLQAAEKKTVPPTAARVQKGTSGKIVPPRSSAARSSSKAPLTTKLESKQAQAPNSKAVESPKAKGKEPALASGEDTAVVPVSKVEDVLGSNVVTYSHYKDSFPTRNGTMLWADIDEKYCITFVFKGSPTLTLVSPSGHRHNLCPNNIFIDLLPDASYALEVEADPTVHVERKTAPLLSRREPIPELSKKANHRVNDITDQLKAMSADEIRERGEEFKSLLEARDLEDILHS